MLFYVILCVCCFLGFIPHWRSLGIHGEMNYNALLTHGARNFFCPRTTLLAIMYSTEYRYEMPVYADKTTMKRSNKRVINLVRGLVRALNTLTYGLSYIMRYIFLVIFSINCTRLRLVQLIEKMTRKIYLIMYSRPYVNAYILIS